MKKENEKYCQDCGQIINIKAEICPKCGVRQSVNSVMRNHGGSVDDNRWLITLLLCFFVGFLGIHRFYTGHKLIGALQLLTFGGCGFWALIDFIILILGDFKDAEGNAIKPN